MGARCKCPAKARKVPILDRVDLRLVASELFFAPSKGHARYSSPWLPCRDDRLRINGSGKRILRAQLKLLSE